MDWTRIVAERKIKDAMDSGEFDDLPGKGKPLELDDDAMIPPHERAAVRILKNARALPEWLQAEKDIARETDDVAKFRERGLKSVASAKTADARGRVSARLRSELRERMRLVNTLILKYNYIAPPSWQKTFIPFRIEREMEMLEIALRAASGEG